MTQLDSDHGHKRQFTIYEMVSHPPQKSNFRSIIYDFNAMNIGINVIQGKTEIHH